MHILCPHCRNPIEVVKLTPEEILCPACGSSFRLEMPSECADLPPVGPDVHLPPLPATVDFSLVPSSPALPQVPGYEVLQLLGRGGMGVVYKARHIKLKRLVALKMILAGPQAHNEELERFRIEAEAVARLRHPNIVQIYEIGEHDGRPYFSLEYLEGGTLAKSLAGKALPPAAAGNLVETLARAIQVAHQAGIVHRDLKPSNVLLVSSGVVSGEWSEGKQPTTNHAPLTPDQLKC